jgi:hypothetical protein
MKEPQMGVQQCDAALATCVYDLLLACGTSWLGDESDAALLGVGDFYRETE